MKEKEVDVNLSIDVIEDNAIARLRFTNADNENIYLDQHVIAYYGEDYGHCFKIIDEDEIKIDYCKMGTTRPSKTEFYITLEPKTTLEVNIPLTGIYQFKKGNNYVIQYSTYPPSRFEGLECAKFKSNIVEMVIK